MIPHDLPPSILALPETDRHTIVLLTGSSGSRLPYERFALRMQQEFGTDVAAWFECRPKSGGRSSSSKLRKLASLSKGELKRTIERPARVLGWPGRAARTFRERVLKHDPLKSAQQRLFAAEVEQLRSHARVEPIVVHDPAAPEFIDRVRRLDPYFLLTLGGPLYSPELFGCVRGIALNQHAGWSPEYRGAHTTAWALYHRDLKSVGTTIHALSSGADAGPIFRRTQACLLPGDDAATCFARVVALGTELMCEVVYELRADKRATVFEQSPSAGTTYLVRDLTGEVRETVRADLARGLLRDELRRARQF